MYINRWLFLFSLLISLALYYSAPLRYSRSFCVICFIVFIIGAVKIVYDDIKSVGFLNFNTLFIFSFFLCSYVYPVFLVDRKSIVGELILNDLNTLNTINRVVALCTIAASVYGLSYSIYRKLGGIKVTEIELRQANVICRRSKYLAIFICIAVMVDVFLFLRTSHDVSIEVNDAPYLFMAFYTIIPIYLVCSAINFRCSNVGKFSIKNYINKNRAVIYTLFITTVLFLYIGDRSPIITITILVVSVIAFFLKKIKFLPFLCCSIIGVLLMFALRVTRGDMSSLSSGGIETFIQATQSSIVENASAWDMLADLVGINMELNAGMDYVDNNGFLYPEANAMILALAPFPFLPTVFTNIFFNSMPEDVTPGPTIGKYTNTSAGNHCVIDIYMPFGIIGIIFFFFIFGLLIAKASNGLNNNLFFKIFYVSIMGFAIFYARNSLTNIYRSFLFAFVIYYILLHINNRLFKRV